MAVKYYSDFNDDDGRAWHIVIHDTTYGGTSPLEFTTGVDGFKLIYEGNDTDRSQSILPSTLEFTYFIQNSNDDQLLADIAGSAEGRYQIEVYYGGATYAAGHLYWRGVLLADIAEYSDEYYPQEFRLIAIDDLAGLRNDDFDTGNSGYAYLKTLVSNCLNRMRSWDITSDTHRATILNWYETQDWNSTYRSAWEYCQLNYANFENTDTFPSTFLTTYEVLEGILSGFAARIYWRASIDPSIDSEFVIDGLNGQQYDTDSFAGITVSNTATSASTTLARQEINLDSTGIKRLAGFRKGWLNPLLKVSRRFQYPSSPFIVDYEYSGVPNSFNFHDGSYDATLHPAPTVEYGEGSLISLRFTASFNHEEGSTSIQAFDAVSKRAGRFKIQAKLRFGQYYAQRALQIQGTTGVYVTDGGAFCQVVTFTENASNWSTSSSATIDWYTPPLVWTDDESLSFQMGIDLTPLPADLTSEDCTVAWTITPVDDDGLTATYIAAIGDLFDNTSPPSILNATIYPTDIFEIGGNEITFKAENANTDAREILDLPNIYFSDLLGTRGGGLSVIANGTRTQPSEWQSDSNLAADINLHNLVAKEYLQGQSRNIKKLSGEVRDSRTSSTAGISLIDTIVHDGDYYSIHGLEFTAARGIYRIDCLQLENSGTVTNPTESFSGHFNNEIIVSGRPPVTPITEVIVGDISEKVDLITITQAVNLDTVESNLDTLYTNLKTGTSTDLYAGADTTTHLELTGTTANLKVNTTGLEITETSPGDIELIVATDSSGSTPFTAVHLDGLTTASTADFLIKEGTNFKIYGSTGYAKISHTGGAVQIALPSSSGTLARTADLYSDSDADARIAAASIDDLSDVDTTTTTPTNGDVLTWDNSASKWVPDAGGGAGGGGSDSFNTIQVSGQSDVVADSGNDTLILAAGTNIVITTNATTDTITFATSTSPTFSGTATITGIALGSTGLLGTGSIQTTGSLGTLGSGNLSIAGTSSFAGDATFSSNLYAAGVQFVGNGTNTIGPSNTGGTQDDLQIESNGNVTIILDDDDDETGQAFIVKNGAGAVIFQVDEDGISSGLFTTTTPTISTVSDFESTQTGTITVSNYDSDLTYVVKLYNSSGTEQTTATITDNSDGTWSITNAPVLTSAYVTVKALEIGKLVSAVATSNSFDITAAQTQMRYWRLQITDASKNPSTSKIALGNFRLYTATGGGGTAYPSNMTSETTPSPYVVTKGYQYSSTYPAWKAMDGSGSSASSMWWTLAISTATDHWIQIDLGSSIDFGSGECQIQTSGGWTDGNYAVLYGSNTGDFTGEEREMAFFQNIDKAGESGGTFTTYTEAIS
jgi:hypothetical protein